MDEIHNKCIYVDYFTDLLKSNGYAVTEDAKRGVKRITVMKNPDGKKVLMMSGRVSEEYLLDKIGVEPADPDSNGGSTYLLKDPGQDPKQRTVTGFIRLFVSEGILKGDFAVGEPLIF